MMMNGFDIQSALEVAKQLHNFQHWANHFGHDRERILQEIGFMADDFKKLAERIEDQMINEMAMIIEDGAACNQLEAA